MEIYAKILHSKHEKLSGGRCNGPSVASCLQNGSKKEYPVLVRQGLGIGGWKQSINVSAACLELLHLKAVAINVAHVVQEAQKQTIPVFKLEASSLLKYSQRDFVTSQSSLEVLVRVHGAIHSGHVVR